MKGIEMLLVGCACSGGSESTMGSLEYLTAVLVMGTIFILFKKEVLDQ